MSAWKKILLFFKRAWNIFKVNAETLIVFEIIYKLAVKVIFLPILQGIIHLALSYNGYAFLSDMNVKIILKSPVTWFVIFLVLIFISLYTLFDICCIVTCYHASYRRQKLPLLAMMKQGVLMAKNIFHPKNYRMMMYLILIIPLSNAVSLSGLLASFPAPEFIVEKILSTYWLVTVCVIALIYVEFLSVQWIFCFHYFTLEGMQFKRATHGSNRLVKGILWKLVVMLLAWNAVWVGVFYGIIYLGGAVIALFVQISASTGVLTVVAGSAVAVLLDVVAAAFYCLAVPLTFLWVSVFYYMLKRKYKESIPGKFQLNEAYRFADRKWFKKVYRKRKLITVLVLVAVLAGNIISASMDITSNDRESAYKSVLVEAHRGSSVTAPENTMPAFEDAVKLGADMIELDVQLTADREVIVLHDDTFKRTLGLDKYAWEVTYDEIKDLDSGSWFSEEFAGTTIARFDEVVDLAKENGIMLNVELKPNTNMDGLAEATIDIIKEKDYMGNCVISSMSYDELTDAKAYDKDIETVYITTLSFGNLSKMEAADGYSIESTMATQSLINKIHKNGKYVYIWTVNNESQMQKMLQLHPDGIITDDIEAAHEMIYSLQHENYWINYVNGLSEVYSAGISKLVNR